MDGEHSGPLLKRNVIANQRLSGRQSSSLSRCNADARKKKMPEVLRRTAEGRHQTPRSQTDRYDVSANPPVGPAGNRDAAARIEDRESQSDDDTELAVGQAQIHFYGWHENRQGHPV